ncbi:MAG: hypothetical protein NTZ68_04370, partial [Candidatus Dependentiae bacterium]|nr:hypothetical protein [Candidatus Dependentiae bacterium]
MTIKQSSLTNKFMLSGLLLVGLTSQIAASLSHDSKINCYKTQRDGSWKYLEYIFVVKPANELKQASSNAQAFMAVAWSIFFARTTMYKFINPKSKPEAVEVKVAKDETLVETALSEILKELKEFKEKAKTTKETTVDLATYLAGLAISGVAYQSYCNSVESSIRINTMTKFLQNWSTHRSNVPEEFAVAFDELSAYYS